MLKVLVEPVALTFYIFRRYTDKLVVSEMFIMQLIVDRLARRVYKKLTVFEEFQKGKGGHFYRTTRRTG